MEKESIQDYVYYAPVRLAVHAPFMSELIRLFEQRYGWRAEKDITKKGSDPSRIVRAFVRGCEAHDERVQTTLFYNTSKGLTRVVLYGEEYLAELDRLLRSQEEEETGLISSYLIIGKTKYVVYREK